MKSNRSGFQLALVAGACRATLAVSAAAMANTDLSGSATFNAPEFATPPVGDSSGLSTTVQYYVPTFGSDKGAGGGYAGAGGYHSFQGGMATNGPTPQTPANNEYQCLTQPNSVLAAMRWPRGWLVSWFHFHMEDCHGSSLFS